jgi:hypothetical protein
LSILKKIPKLEDIAAVYAVIVVIIYYPSINSYFWKFPSWILFSTLGDLFNIYAYMVTVNFLESLLVLFAVLALCIVLPRKWFYNYFVSRGSLLVILTLGFLIYLGHKIQPDMSLPFSLFRMLPIALIIILALVFLLGQIGWLRKILEEIAARLIVFLYISIPISIFSFLVVVVRNAA